MMIILIIIIKGWVGGRFNKCSPVCEWTCKAFGGDLINYCDHNNDNHDENDEGGDHHPWSWKNDDDSDNSIENYDDDDDIDNYDENDVDVDDNDGGNDDDDDH